MLIIGASGYIGKALTSHLSRAGHQVIASQRLSEAAEHYLDLSKGFEKANFAHLRIDVVCVLAAMTDIKQCQRETALAKKVNIESTCQLLKHFHDKGCFIVYLSSNHVFANQAGVIEISKAYNPRSHYGENKALVEEFIKQEQLKAAIVRPTKIIGANFQLFDYWLSCWQQGNSVTVFDDHFVAPVSLKHLTSYIELLLKNKVHGIFHCSGEEAISYAVLADTLLKKLASVAHFHSLSFSFSNTSLLTITKAESLGVKADVASVLSTCGQPFAYPADKLDDVLTEYIRGKFD